MSTLIRTTIMRLMGKKSPFLSVTSITHVPQCGIAGREMRACMKQDPKPEPFDYETKNYTYLRSLFDRTTLRFDQNSKVVVVEGPVAVGKTEFAAQLAKELDMKHYPEPNMDYHYIRPTGVNLRDLDHLIPEDTRTFDHKNFCLDPTNRLAANFQIMMYSARYSQYIDALAHVLNTGQGVVLERCPYSDFVFAEAMFKEKYMSKGARSVYYDVRTNTMHDLIRPHLVIYLDIPVKTVQEQIKKRGLEHEVKSKVFTTSYLETIEEQYKHKYLRDISTHAELLVYDWSGGGETEVVVEDIERLDFDKYTERTEPKMKDWRLMREIEWADLRMIYTNNKANIMNNFNIPRCDVPELITSADDAFEQASVYDETPGLKYTIGYNVELGDTNLLTKNKKPKLYEHL